VLISLRTLLPPDEDRIVEALREVANGPGR